MPITSLTDFLNGKSGRAGSAIGTPELKLSDWTVSHDSIDAMEFDNFADDSPRFKRLAVDEAPTVTPEVADPDPIDFTTASSTEIAEWQQAARTARAARDDAPPYSAWSKLTRDVFATYHTHETPQVLDGPVNPGVEPHRRIVPKLITTDEHAKSRNQTRDDATMAAIATMAAVGSLKDTLGDELAEQAREAQEYADAAQQAAEAHDDLTDMRQQAQDLHQQGKPIPQALRDAIKAAVGQRNGAQATAAQAAAQQTPMSAAALQAIEDAASAGQQAAENAANLPSFGAGFGAGEPTYESPEQALSIAELWANNPDLRAMAERFGRLDKDIRFKRSKRVVGGNDEIVDVEFGDNLARLLPDELALFADEDYEDDFLMRYCSEECLVFATVGEENAGRGPIVAVIDGSYSMQGERTIWTRAVAMCLLHIARIEHRDFACVEFASQGECQSWLFPAKAELRADAVVDMASHFYGGGTSPVQGVAAAAKLMQDAAEFRKADIVMIGDGEAGFGTEDARLRDQLIELGVRLFGIAIGSGTYKYLSEYCEHVVNVHDFDLADPSAATAELATHIS